MTRNVLSYRLCLNNYLVIIQLTKILLEILLLISNNYKTIKLTYLNIIISKWKKNLITDKTI